VLFGDGDHLSWAAAQFIATTSRISSVTPISTSMIVNTQRLFVKLVSTMRICTVCDVGSMDGTDSLTFRDAVPE
jgi:hypothetical protein